MILNTWHEKKKELKTIYIIFEFLIYIKEIFLNALASIKYIVRTKFHPFPFDFVR